MSIRSLYRSITYPILVAGVLLAVGGCLGDAGPGGPGGPPPGPGVPVVPGRARRHRGHSVIRLPTSRS